MPPFRDFEGVGRYSRGPMFRNSEGVGTPPRAVMFRNFGGVGTSQARLSGARPRPLILKG